MKLEEALLKINENDILSVKFKDALELRRLLEEIGKITSLAIELQSAHYDKYKDTEALSAYHDELMGTDVDYDASDALNLIERLSSDGGLKDGAPSNRKSVHVFL